MKDEVSSEGSNMTYCHRMGRNVLKFYRNTIIINEKFEKKTMLRKLFFTHNPILGHQTPTILGTTETRVRHRLGPQLTQQGWCEGLPSAAPPFYSEGHDASGSPQIPPLVLTSSCVPCPSCSCSEPSCAHMRPTVRVLPHATCPVACGSS